MHKTKTFLIAQLGRAVGLKGELKLNLHTDFPEQFKVGRVFKTQRGDLKIQSYNPKRGLIKFESYDTPEVAKSLTNTKLYSNEEETKEYCNLKENQYFWFDLMGCNIVENSEVLGKVKDISRLPQGDYFVIDTNSKLIEEGLPKSFMLPYIPNFIVSVDIDSKTIDTTGAKDILEAS
jgi:16S rRNA processing protein RimM